MVVFEQISTYLSLPIDKVRYVVLFFLSYPLAFILRRIFHYKYTSSTVRHVYSVLLGILFCWICFEWQTLYLVTFVSLGYLFLVMIPPRNVHIYSMIYAMLGVSAGHIYRMVTDYGGYKLDFTGPLMLMVQRISYVAFAYHDGTTVDNTALNSDQLKQKVNSLPAFLEYFSYNFSFLTVLAGPTATYKEYDEFITGKDITSAINENCVSEPNGYVPMLKKLFHALVFMLIMLLYGSRMDKTLLLNPTLSYPQRFLNVIIFCFIGRCQYYFTYSLSGLGFNGFDDKGKAKWDTVKSIDISNFEFGTNVRAQAAAWNITTSNWIRRVVYERSIFNPVISSFVISALWHGFYPGYYMSFLFMAMVVLAGRKMRRLLWHQFQSPWTIKLLYDIASTLSTNVLKDFAHLPFVLLLLDDVIAIWSYYYFMPIVIVLVIIFVLPNKSKEKTK